MNYGAEENQVIVSFKVEENQTKPLEIANFKAIIKSENFNESFPIDKHSDKHGEIYHTLMSELPNEETTSNFFPKTADYSTFDKEISEHNECTSVDVREKLFMKSNAEMECLTTHYLIEKCKPNHTCDVCSKAFKKPLQLKRHIRSHSGEKPYTCEIFGKAFTQAPNLKCHMRIHSGEKPYTCEICRKGFTQASKLKCHIRIHSGKKPYTCEICRKGFTKDSSLKCHMRIHLGEKPYTCEICGKAFAHASTLGCHMRIHSGEKPYTCEICRKGLTKNSNLKYHMRIHLVEN